MTITSLDTGKTWQVSSYGSDGGINRDPYYQENLVVGDMPDGIYEPKSSYIG